ncbi:MAG: hypothetical protein LUH18_03580 [Oscillospiraceae bacterium]|nr:hypothetical protein [Oscillospiraceae bacterium]
MRKLIAIVASVLLLTGCTSSDVQKRLVVTAIGIGENSISFQAFSPENEIEVYTFECHNLREAAEDLSLRTGKEVFLGDTELIIFSGNENIEPYLVTLWHSPDIFMGTPVAFTEASPEEILKIPSEDITAILTVSGEEVGLIDLYNEIYSPEESAKLPLLSETGEISGEIVRVKLI